LLHLTSLGVFLLFAFLWDRTPEQSGEKRVWSRLELTTLAIILIVAAFMRLYRLNEFPFGTYYDEADNGLNARRILQEPDYRPVYVESTHLPAHYLYLVAGAFQLFGVSTYSMRLASVALGLATVAAGYLAGRELFDRRWGLATAFLLAASRWDVNWSRTAMHGVTTPLFTLLAMGFAIARYAAQSPERFCLGGLVGRPELVLYVPLRVFPLSWQCFSRTELSSSLVFCAAYGPA